MTTGEFRTTSFHLRPKQVIFDDEWARIEPIAIKTLSCIPVPKTQFHDTFTDIYNICVAIPDSYSERLYKAVKKLIQQHCLIKFADIGDNEGPELIKAYIKEFEQFKLGIQSLDHLFKYLNRQFVSSCDDDDDNVSFTCYQNNDVYEIEYLGFVEWQSYVAWPLKEQLCPFLIEQLNLYRDTHTAKVEEVKSLINSLDILNEYPYGGRFIANKRHEFYKCFFHDDFIAFTTRYYIDKAKEEASHRNIVEYISNATKWIAEEKALCILFLKDCRQQSVIKLVYDILVRDHLQWLNDQTEHLMMVEDCTTLGMLYQLLAPIDSLGVLDKTFQKYILQKGQEFLSEKDNTPGFGFVNAITKLYKKIIVLRNEQFENNSEICGAFYKAFSTVVNSKDASGNCRAAENIARYADILLRNANKSKQAETADLGYVTLLFRYLEDKDLFVKYYSRFLANRLISKSSFSMATEKKLVNDIKEACGYEFTSQLSRMLTDAVTSDSLSERFEKNKLQQGSPESKVAFPFSTDFFTLSNSAWTMLQPQEDQNGYKLLALPPYLDNTIKTFEAFYEKKYSARVLEWQYQHCHVELMLNTPERQYTLCLSLFQALILLAFDRRDSMALDDLAIMVGMSEALTQSNVLILSSQNLLYLEQYCGRMIVYYNLNFRSSRSKIRMPLPQPTKIPEKKPQPEEMGATELQDRKYHIECAIVRIMKARKQMMHSELFSELNNQLGSRFSPDIPMVKRAISDLLERMYIQRGESEDEYRYVA